MMKLLLSERQTHQVLDNMLAVVLEEAVDDRDHTKDQRGETLDPEDHLTETAKDLNLDPQGILGLLQPLTMTTQLLLDSVLILDMDLLVVLALIMELQVVQTQSMKLLQGPVLGMELLQGLVLGMGPLQGLEPSMQLLTKHMLVSSLLDTGLGGEGVEDLENKILYYSL